MVQDTGGSRKPETPRDGRLHAMQSSRLNENAVTKSWECKDLLLLTVKPFRSSGYNP